MATELLTPTDASWDSQRGAFNVLIDQQPAAIACPDSAEEVAAVVRVGSGRRQANRGPAHRPRRCADGRSGGHDAAAHRRPRRCRDRPPRPSTARVGAGALWGEIVPPASELGLAALHGSTPTVCVSRLHARRRVSWLRPQARPRLQPGDARSSWSPPTGERRRVDAETDPDLFWALRGGGGSFGVVTALEFELLRCRRSTPGRSSSRPSAPARYSTPGASGRRPRPRRSPRSAGC